MYEIPFSYRAINHRYKYYNISKIKVFLHGKKSIKIKLYGTGKKKLFKRHYIDLEVDCLKLNCQFLYIIQTKS